ncbi:MAG TPA: peptidoglycan-binding domain-containing protein [Candidatus Baltobacteraceae bacterium]|nr:peptidoglycan-binding domain-containing protein [Candidatus Baltobacteraceae bacterium]
MKAAILAFAMLTLAVPSLALAQADLNAGIEARIREAFADAPEMFPIAKCESGIRQFAPDGSVLRGGPGGRYVGIFQIDEPLHTAWAASLGFDILTIDGNIGYARHLYDAKGTKPWGCAPSAPAPVSAAPPASITLDLRLGMVDAQVKLLQQALNAHGFAVAASGPGSPGNETARFGALTLDAVRRFQCAKNIVCAGAPSTTGYGRVGPRTRAALNAAE